MAKNNIRSFRYSDEVAAALDAQPGSSLNDKFESLVLYCSFELERKQRQHSMYDRMIADARDKLRAYDSMIETMEKIQAQLRRLDADAVKLAEMGSVTQSASDLEEKCVTAPAPAEPVRQCSNCIHYDSGSFSCVDCYPTDFCDDWESDSAVPVESEP